MRLVVRHRKSLGACGTPRAGSRIAFASHDAPASGMTVEKTNPRPSRLPYPARTPVHMGRAAERLCGAGAVTRMRQRPYRRGRLTRGSSPRIPGPRIEAVQAWQHTARTPVAQRRSLREARSSSRSWTREALPEASESRTDEPADDVTAPSARQQPARALKGCPICCNRIAVLRRPRSLSFSNPRG